MFKNLSLFLFLFITINAQSEINKETHDFINNYARSKEADGYLNELKSLKTPYEINFEGIKIQITENVYPPAETSVEVARLLKDKKFGLRKGEKVLDYGTGSGSLAIFAAMLGANVVAIDINAAAINCAITNAKRYGLDAQIDFRVSENLSAIKDNEKFNTIIAILPWENAEPNDLLEAAFYDKDFSMRKALFNNAKNLLLPNGKIIFVYSERVQSKIPIQAFNDKYRYEIVKKIPAQNDTEYVYYIYPDAYA